jgi:type I restriction enzyme M protein
MSTGSNFNYASFVWGVADKLRGTYKRHEYGKVILPFVVLRRLDCTLEASKKEVLAKAKSLKSEDVSRDFLLQKISGYSFYNTSPYDLQKLLGDPSNLKANLQAYIAGFSANLRDVFERYDFDAQIARLEESDLLMLITQEFLKIDMHPDVIDNAQMGHIFEELIAKAMEASNEEAGEYFTPRDVVRLIVNLLFSRDDEALSKTGIVRSIYDPTAGTGGMLSVAEDHIRGLNPDAQLTLYGQERNAESYALAKTDHLIKGQSADNMYFGDTLTNDGHWDKTFDYGLANPPFGVEWKKQQDEVTIEHENRGFNGRFGAGLPRVSDGSLLFLMHLVSKMRSAKEGGGRIGIVLNGSPLSTGNAGSGESEIRKWLLDSDLIETIVALPKEMFYNTDITTYIWILDNQKPKERRGKVQLIDASKKFEKMRKGVGNKRNEIKDVHVDWILQSYFKFEESEESRIFNAEDFRFRAITIEQPLKLNWAVTEPRIENVMSLSALTKLSPEIRKEIRSSLTEAEKNLQETYFDKSQFADVLTGFFSTLNLKPGQINHIIQGLSLRDENAPPEIDKDGQKIPDPTLRFIETIPASADVSEFMTENVHPYLPDSWVDTSADKFSYEIPFTRYFYEYEIPPTLTEIDTKLNKLVLAIEAQLKALSSR